MKTTPLTETDSGKMIVLSRLVGLAQNNNGWMTKFGLFR
jgi:hypothetical protein